VFHRDSRTVIPATNRYQNPNPIRKKSKREQNLTKRVRKMRKRRKRRLYLRKKAL